jgi:hypothetical protein
MTQPSKPEAADHPDRTRMRTPMALLALCLALVAAVAESRPLVGDDEPTEEATVEDLAQSPEGETMAESDQAEPDQEMAEEIAGESDEVLAEEPEEGCWGRWDGEREELVDLLLDGDYEAARAKAEELLAEPELPEGPARRVSELRMRAIAELDRREPAADAPSPPPLDVTFRVRSTRPGRSFRAGAEGRLRISSRGIAFVPEEGSDDDGWSIPWRSFASAGEAEGIWDVAHPLVLETGDGDKFFLTEVKQDGRFGDGEEILRYVEKGRKRHGGKEAR